MQANCIKGEITNFHKLHNLAVIQQATKKKKKAKGTLSNHDRGINSEQSL